MLVRAENRRREVALRRALGASSARLVRLFLAEGVLLALFAVAFGLTAAYWVIPWLFRLIPERSLRGMPYFQEVGLHPRVLLFACAAALLALAMGYHVIFGQNGLTAYQQKRQDAQTLDLQLHSLQRENELLKGHVDRLQNDPNAIEHQAREELHYTRPGEVIYTLPASSGSSGAPSEPATGQR